MAPSITLPFTECLLLCLPDVNILLNIPEKFIYLFTDVTSELQKCSPPRVMWLYKCHLWDLNPTQYDLSVLALLAIECFSLI